jgi:hypothetical protein
MSQEPVFIQYLNILHLILIPFVCTSEKAVRRDKFDDPLQEQLVLIVQSIKKYIN